MIRTLKPLVFASVVLFILFTGATASAGEVSAVEALIEKQLDAYNARDLEAFLAFYSDEAELHSLATGPLGKGKADMRKRYSARFSDSLLHAVIVKRMVMGSTVVDHERIHVTLPEGPGVMEAIAIYEVRDMKIAKVTFISGPRTVGAKP